MIFPVRWRIFGFLFGIGFLAYLQQRSITVAAARIIPELHFSQMQIALLEWAFVMGYALFQLPGGVLGQRRGARWTFLGIGCLSTLCVGLTAAAPLALAGAALFVMLFAAQFTLGVSHAPIFPVSTGVFESWFPPRHWALVQGLQTMGLSLGAALAPPMIATLMATIGWQRALLWTAIPAIPLYLLWTWYGRNSPREHAAVSPQELALLQHTGSEQANARLSARDLLAILRNRNVLWLALSYLAMNYVFYLLANWCFLYLVQQRGFSELNSRWLAMAPPITAGIGAGIGGAIASALFVRLGSRRGLRLTPLVALPAAGVLLVVAVHAASAYVAIAVLALCYGLVELTEGSYWAAAMTIGRSNTMAVGGVLNTGGNLGGVIGIPVVGWLSGHGHWNAAFLVGTGFACLSAALWLLIDAGDSVDVSSGAQPSA
ncbi:MAG TPA: MFS transporter [Steroidobacteraceae bacterium]|nr:MFS transporter [Steroidobacteraceae bacterium]